MTESTPTEDPRLLAIAAAIAKGEPVDWASLPADADPDTTTVLGELRSIEHLGRVGRPIPDQWGAFAITGELGHGSYGTVYRAFDADLGLDIALKIIRLEPSDEAGASHALREARLLAQISHPNVVRIYSAERVGADVGIAMELVHGQTLHHLVRSNGPCSASEAMLIGSDLCRAVAAVHAARLLHGDIKANNVMRAQGGRTVLMDFGAGDDLKFAPRAWQQSAIGTPIYLAPEVLAGAPATSAADIYSVGVLLFYLATGSYPVPGHSRAEVEQQHAARAPRRLLRDIRPDLPESFIHVVERATAHRPEERFATAGELEAALVRALRNEEAPKPRVSWAKRWTLPLAAALVAGLAGLGYQAWADRDRGATTQTAAALSTATPAAPADAAAADAYQVEAAFYRHEGSRSVRLQPGARIARGEQLSLQIRSSVPTYVYVVNEDEKGESYLLFPLPDQQLTNPVPAGERHEIPGVVNGARINWVVSSAGGQEHFLVFVTPQPLSPAMERRFAALPKASMDQPAMAQRLPDDLVGALRGVGGLAKAPATSAAERLSRAYVVPLPEKEETARGVWVRQLTLENPVR